MRVILEGFLEAEKVHGVCYTRFIGDGNSLDYPTLIQNVPWGYAIEKPTMHVNAIGVHLSNSSTTTPPIKVAED